MKSKEQIKQSLLNTGYFEDNEYLDKYCDLVIIKSTKQDSLKTQEHHCIPICYYKLIYNFKKDLDAKKKANLDSNNYIINILYKDHILVHYYLCFCSKPKLKNRLINAFFHLTNRKWKYTDFNPETDLEEYQKLYEEWIIHLKKDKERKQKIKNYFKNNNHSSCYTKEVKNKMSQNMRGRLGLHGRKVICIENQLSFTTESEASLWLGKGDITACLYKNSKGEYSNLTAGGYHWAYLDDKERQEELKEFIGKDRYSFKGKPNKCLKIECLETNLIYNSIKEASGLLHISTESIINSCKGRKGNYKLHFKYLK